MSIVSLANQMNGMQSANYSQMFQNVLGSGLTQQASPLAPAKSTLPDGKTLLVIGPYILIAHHDQEWIQFCRVGGENGPVCIGWWQQSAPPSRALLAATIAHDRRQLPLINARDAFGGLLGVRRFALTADYHLQSPQQKTVWDSNVLSVANWIEDEVVRGVAGIHAAWPPRGRLVMPSVDALAKTETARTVLARVRCAGRFVAGKTGWRGERVIVDTVYLPPSIANRWRVRKRLDRLYPDVSFEEETWTLERSLKSAKSLLSSCR